jgi:hypothetical protein
VNPDIKLKLYYPPEETRLTLLKPDEDIRDTMLLDDIQTIIEGAGSAFDKACDILAIVREERGRRKDDAS